MNEKLASIFYEMAEILEFKKVKWKPQAYIIASQTIEGLNQDVLDIYLKKGIRGLEELPGIGEGIARKIVQYIKTEKIDEFEKLKKSIPRGIYEIMKIQGIGPKKASIFYEKLRIRTTNDLKKAVLSHKLLGLGGFKAKSEKNILEAIELLKTASGRISLKRAEKIAEEIKKELEKIKDVKKVEIAGSIRRRKSTIGDIDIVVQTRNSEKVSASFLKSRLIKKILNRGKEKLSFISNYNLGVDVRFFTYSSFGSGLLYFTGDKQYNIWMRKIAIKKGLKLNEYGLFKGNRKLAGKSEKEILDYLGIKMFSPENRGFELKNKKEVK